jgi:hypothetical protein
MNFRFLTPQLVTSVVGDYESFGDICRIYIQADIKINAVCSSETFLTNEQTTVIFPAVKTSDSRLTNSKFGESIINIYPNKYVTSVDRGVVWG